MAPCQPQVESKPPRTDQLCLKRATESWSCIAPTLASSGTKAAGGRTVGPPSAVALVTVMAAAAGAEFRCQWRCRW